MTNGLIPIITQLSALLLAVKLPSSARCHWQRRSFVSNLCVFAHGPAKMSNTQTHIITIPFQEVCRTEAKQRNLLTLAKCFRLGICKLKSCIVEPISVARRYENMPLLFSRINSHSFQKHFSWPIHSTRNFISILLSHKRFSVTESLFAYPQTT